MVFWLNENEAKYTIDCLRRGAERICDRSGAGIAADGILVLIRNDARDLVPSKLKIINSDGSMAKNCGNGLRCAAGSIYSRYQDHRSLEQIPRELNLQVEDQNFLCRILNENSLGKKKSYIAINMGVPKLNDANSFHKDVPAALNALGEQTDAIASQSNHWSTCSIGNQHLVFFNESQQSSTNRDLLRDIGPKIQKTPFWDGINVHVASEIIYQKTEMQHLEVAIGGSISEVYEVFTWERGAGETQACGSGACAVAAAILQEGLTPRDQWLCVKMPGGHIFLQQQDQDEDMLLCGPTEFVFRGSLEI